MTGDAPVTGDASLAAMLAGDELPAGSGPELRPLADVLAGLRGHAASDELAGEAETLAAFRSQFGASDVAHWPRARRSPLRLRPVGAAVVAAATILSLGGIAAAYAGALPTGLQRLAHDIIRAPAPATRPVISPSRAAPGTSHGSGR